MLLSDAIDISNNFARNQFDLSSETRTDVMVDPFGHAGHAGGTKHQAPGTREVKFHGRGAPKTPGTTEHREQHEVLGASGHLGHSGHSGHWAPGTQSAHHAPCTHEVKCQIQEALATRGTTVVRFVHFVVATNFAARNIFQMDA